MDKRRSDESKQRLARIAGQVNGIQRMIDEERNCVDILTQVAAIRSAVDQFGIVLLSTHLEKCVTEQSSDDAEKPSLRLDEIRSSLEHFLQVAGSEA